MMKGWALLAAMLVGASLPLHAQRGDAKDPAQACSGSEGPDRTQCLDEEGQKKPNKPSAEQAELQNWLISETTSPVDYAPQISASTVGRELASGAPAWLTIYCRGRHADLAISTDSIRKTISSTVLKVVYRINGDSPVEARWMLSDNRTAIVFQGEAGSLLLLMPDQGRMHVRVQTSSQPPIELDYQLDGLSVVRRRIAKVCNLSSS